MARRHRSGIGSGRTPKWYFRPAPALQVIGTDFPGKAGIHRKTKDTERSALQKHWSNFPRPCWFRHSHAAVCGVVDGASRSADPEPAQLRTGKEPLIRFVGV